MTLEQESRRGEQARRLLEDPLLQEAFAAVDGALRDAWPPRLMMQRMSVSASGSCSSSSGACALI
jgi:hypothetical protein